MGAGDISVVTLREMRSVTQTATKALPPSGRQQGPATNFVPGLLHSLLPDPCPPLRFELTPKTPFLFWFLKAIEKYEMEKKALKGERSHGGLGDRGKTPFS